MAGLYYAPDRQFVPDKLDFLERMEAMWDAEDEIAEQRAERRRQEGW